MDDSNLSSILKPTQASSAPRTEYIQVRILAESDASSKRTRANEGPANNPKRRKRQENSSIPWNRHHLASTGVGFRLLVFYLLGAMGLETSKRILRL